MSTENTGTIKITWDDDNLRLDLEEKLLPEIEVTTEAAMELFLEGLKRLRLKHGDQCANELWEDLKHAVEHEVFVYTVHRRLPPTE